MSAITLRRARAEDAEAFEAVIRAAYAPWLERLEGLPDVAGGIAQDIAEREVWLAVDPAGQVLGGVVVALSDTSAHVANLAVVPEAGGQGVGRLLMQKAEALAGEAGHRDLNLATHREMTSTLAFYGRLGWSETGRDGLRVFLSKAL